jgi:D-3-phosphoglycerate dehydrogenase
MTTTLVLSEALPEPGMRVLATRPDVRLRLLDSPDEAALARALPEADGVIMVMEEPRFSASLIALAPRLRIACRFGAGHDNLDIAALTRRRIPLATTGAANADAVAEHALYLMLALARRGPALERAVKAGAWPRGFGGIELVGKTCLVVGYGRIGRAIARRAAALAMRVLIVDPARREADGHELATDLDAAIARADVVVLACALDPSTRGLVDAARLARFKPAAFLVNVARGAVVDQAALATALREGRLAGAGLDVLAREPPAADDPLLAMDRVVLSPHVAAYNRETYARMAEICARHALAGLDGTLTRDAVANPEVFDR